MDAAVHGDTIQRGGPDEGLLHPHAVSNRTIGRACPVCECPNFRVTALQGVDVEPSALLTGSGPHVPAKQRSADVIVAVTSGKAKFLP